jgi:hypothetical protein
MSNANCANCEVSGLRGGFTLLRHRAQCAGVTAGRRHGTRSRTAGVPPQPGADGEVEHSQLAGRVGVRNACRVDGERESGPGAVQASLERLARRGFGERSPTRKQRAEPDM